MRKATFFGWVRPGALKADITPSYTMHVPEILQIFVALLY